AQEVTTQQVATTDEQKKVTSIVPKAKTQVVTYFENTAYREAFQIPSEKIADISNNTGHYSNRVIEHAIDNDLTTYWETNSANSTTWNNEVTVTFTEEVEFSRIVFGARPDQKGFATKFEVYASPTSEGETFELISTGEHNSTTGLVEAEFAATKMQRVKLKFIESTQNWATLTELAFFQTDEIRQAVNEVFTDETKSNLNPTYANAEALEELVRSAILHPLAEDLLPVLADAKALLNHIPVEATIANVQKFEAFENEAYSAVFKMPTSNIASITNNGGHYANKVIENAVDEDLSTYWETNRANSSSWNNEVIVTLKEATILNRIVFGARPDQKGFATKFEIYASPTAEGETFELLATGEHTSVTGLIEAQFTATEIKRVKLKFIESTQNWATLTELAFYTQDRVADAMQELFTDETKSTLNEAYANETVLTQLSEAVKNHPLAEKYKTALEDAWILQQRVPAQATIAQTRPFVNFENAAYNAQFKVATSKITSITNNGGHYANKVINNALDDDAKTYWETNRLNSATWQNEVTVHFDQKELINRLVFGARGDSKGFATKFEVYASATSEGETFELITTGGYSATNTLVEVEFEPTQVKRLKFKFIESTEQSATLTELAFYKTDAVANVVHDLFIDQTYVTLKPQYADKEILEQINEAVQEHPGNTELVKIMELALASINGTINDNYTLMTANQDGDMNAHAKNTLSMMSAGQNYQATGVYGLPGETIVVYLDVEPGTKNLPQIGFSQNQGTWRGYVKTTQLYPGRNEITVPVFDLDSGSYEYRPNPGGAAYIVNPYTEEQQGRAPKIRIEGGHDFPFYRQGDDAAEFVEEVNTYYKKLMAAQAVGDTSVLDLLEVESDRVLISTLASSGYQVFVTEGQSPITTVNHWNDTFNALLAFNGLDGSAEVHDPKQLKEHVRVMQPYGALYAYVCHVGIQTGHASAVLREGFLNSWGMAHETGHRFDNRYRTWAEVTNNMEATYASALTGTINDRIKYEEVYKKIAVDNDNHQFGDGGYFVTLAAFWQLQMANESYWPELNRMYRERRPSIPTAEIKNDTLVEYSSEVFGVDLTEHFSRHGLIVSDEIANELAQTYPQANKYWYLNTKAWEYEGPGLAVSETATIEGLSSTGQLTFSTTANDADLLGYEVLRNGEVIGFTRTNTFIDDNYNTAENYEYTVIPYGADLVAGTPSAGYHSYTPIVTMAQQELYLPLYATFNPLDYVHATNYVSEVISDQIQIESTVQTDVKGEYEVVYSVTDQDITVQKKMTVHVIAEATPLTNFEWKTASQSYAAPKKDINLNGNPLALTNIAGSATTYERGLGTHANAELVYDLSSGDYDRFQSYVGIDHDMSTKVGTITFEVYVDGVKRYDSGVMKAGDAQKYLSIDIAGASELKLVVTDAGNGNSADHATWGNPVLLTVSAKPELSIPSNSVYEVGSQLDETTLIGSYQAHDVEDGDLTDQVQVTGFETVVTTKPGNYEITYRVTDRDGNLVTKTRQVAIVDLADYVYLTDYEWTKATQSYSSTQKDQHVSGSPLRLTDQFGASVTYERGLGTHANAEIVYDLTQTDAVLFTTYVGVDRVMYNSTASSIVFEIYVDGKKAVATDVMRAKDPQQYLQVDIAGAKELKLVVTDAGNGNGSDHGSFGDAKLHYVNDARADLTPLQTLITELDALDTTSYSA
ncbi:MAG: NPCBM/NEW2 domain-containing protein, partial [Culicoidibacterales bacterium]